MLDLSAPTCLTTYPRVFWDLLGCAIGTGLLSRDGHTPTEATNHRCAGADENAALMLCALCRRT